MPQSLSRIILHIIFSTKGHLPMLSPDIQADLYAYMAGTLKGLESPAFIINGVEDHVHILYNLSRNLSASHLIEELKKSSTKWMKTKGGMLTKFQWQVGYGAFSVSQSKEKVVYKYIENQKEHHKKISFKDKLRRFLKEYNVEFDERYIWD